MNEGGAEYDYVETARHLNEGVEDEYEFYKEVEEWFREEAMLWEDDEVGSESFLHGCTGQV